MRRGGGIFTGRGAARGDDADDLAGASDWRLLRRFVPFLWPHRHLVGWALLTLALSMPFVVAVPDLVRRAVDGPLRDQESGGLGWVILLIVGVLAAKFALDAWHQWVVSLLGQRVMSDLRRRAFDHLLRLHPGYYDRTPTGWLVTRITGDIETMHQLLTQGLVISLGDLASLLVIAGYLWWTHASLAAVTLAPVPVMWVLMWWFQPQARAVHRRARTALARISAHLHESVEGIRALKALRAEASATDQMRERLAAFRAANLDAVRIYSWYFPAVDFVAWSALALLLVLGGRWVAGASITSGEFFAFWLLAERFFEPIRQLTNRAGVLQAALTGAERLGRVLDERPAIADPARPEPPPRDHAVEFRGVTFDYGRGGAPVLDEVSFGAAPGETVALVGHTGAGKSTVLALCARFYDAKAGAVVLGGADVRALPVAEVRARMAYAPQDPVLVGATVGAAIGFDGADGDARAEAALRRLGAEDLLARLPQGVATPLADRGESLSAGERQLCSLARALATGAPILLLDEALSQVDPETEARALAGLRASAGDRVILVAAHRLATIQDADQILVFHRGRLVERGTHRALIATQGRYRTLYELQRLDALLAERTAS